MPLYEYKCKKCGHRFEKIVKFSDPPVKKCPKCKGVLEQLISSPAIQFKGTGWYVTDYAAKTGQPPAEESTKKPEESAKKPEETKSSEQKADEKSDAKAKDKKKDAAPKAAKDSKSTEKATADKRR